MKFQFREGEWIEGERPPGVGFLSKSLPYIVIAIGLIIAIIWVSSGYVILTKFFHHLIPSFY